MSVLLITCWRPVTLGSLESCPSMTKLLPRGRVPFTEKFVRSKGRVAAVELADARRGERKGEDVAEPTCAADAARRVCRQVRNSLGVETHADFGIGSV